MTTNIILPHLGESVESAILVDWHKQVGDEVKRGQELADVETDKATMPLECPRNGVLLAILVEPGTEVRIGDLLAVVGKAGESWSPEPEETGTKNEDQSPSGADSLPVQASTPLPAPSNPGRKLRISPVARRRAKELGIDINTLQPAQGDKVTAEDVERYANLTTAGPADSIPSHRVPLNNLRKIVARRMLESAQNAPQFSVSVNVDLTRLQAFRQGLANEGSKVSVTAVLVYWVAESLKQHPRLNARYDGDDILVYDTCNIGVAVATSDGLRVPVIQGVEKLSLLEIGKYVTLLADKARDNHLSRDDIANGTFTISNLGMMGVAQFVPLVNPPQAAILGVGEAQAIYVPGENGTPQAVQQMNLTVSADHRVVDGADVSAFLATLKTTIEQCAIDLEK